MKRTLVLIRISIAAVLTLPAAAASNTPRLDKPVGGYIEKAGQLKAIIGSPGAAYVGPAMAVEHLENAALCSASEFVLALTPNRQGVRLLRLSPDAIAEATVIATLDTPIDAVVLSPSCTAAALINRAESSLSVITGLPAQPKRQYNWVLPTNMVSAAIADDGLAAVIATTLELQIVDALGSRVIASGRALRDVSFRPLTHDVVYGDVDMVAGIAAVSSVPVQTVLATSADGLLDVRSSLFSSNGQQILIADAGAKELLVVNVSGGPAHRVSLPCVPLRLETLNRSTVRLRCESEKIVNVISLSGGLTRVLFIPE